MESLDFIKNNIESALKKINEENEEMGENSFSAGTKHAYEICLIWVSTEIKGKMSLNTETE